MSSISKRATTLRVASYFLAGQGMVQMLAMVVGLLLVHVLSVGEYALYTVASTLLAIVTLGSNIGLGQGIVSLGAPEKSDVAHVGALWRASRQICIQLFPISVSAAVLLATYMFHGLSWSIFEYGVCVVFVLVIGLLQLDTALARSVLNIHHDAHGIFLIGIAEGSLRLILVSLCIVWPLALVALSANLLGAMLARSVAIRRINPFTGFGARATSRHRRQLWQFIIPLTPMVLYTLLQGQLAIIILSAQSNTEAIAQFGALSRIGQLFTVLVMLNPFLVQPIFARVSKIQDFDRKILRLTGVLVVFSVIVIFTAKALPWTWLLLLGSNYANLTEELPIVVATAVAALTGATYYTIVISRGVTRGQIFVLAPCIASQVFYIVAKGLNAPWDVGDALGLGLTSSSTYLACQLYLLVTTRNNLRDRIS